MDTIEKKIDEFNEELLNMLKNQVLKNGNASISLSRRLTDEELAQIKEDPKQYHIQHNSG